MFGAGVLGSSVGEPGHNFQRGYADAPKTFQSAPLPTINLKAPVEML
jgi:hypothetical protein